MKHKYFLSFITFAVICIIGILDILSTNLFILSAVYLVIILIAATYINKYYAVFLSFLAVCFYLHTMILSNDYSILLMFWNSAMIFCVYLLVIYQTLIIKKKNQELEKIIQDKNILIREIHHRVKNNFNSIRSLVNLTLDMNSSDPVKSIQSRLNTYGLLYEKLSYSQEDNVSVNFNEFINDLIKLIFDTYKESSSKINFKFSGDEFDIDSKIANTIGLIINELATNSIKYAFNNMPSGIIELNVIRKDKTIVMAYSDNGCGFDPDLIDPRKKHLGVILIENLTEQLNGSMTCDFNNGSEYMFEFRIR